VRSHRYIGFVATVAMTIASAVMNISARSITSFESDAPDLTIHIVKTPTDGGIREEIPAKYRERFDKWKSELLETDFGRDQWNKYASNQSFILTILVSGNRKGAGTDKYQWNDEGKLVGATITLGAALEDGSPPPIYYPVLNSLSADTTTHTISGPIIAATRLSHELGHVNQTAEASMNLIQTQNKLILQYNSIFVENGLNSKDTRLLDIAGQMNGTPVQIWESREYWSEVNAMLFRSQRINRESFYCLVFKKIRRNIETYAKAYEDRFSKYPEFTNSPCWK
jgi:hypothetical protein